METICVMYPKCRPFCTVDCKLNSATGCYLESSFVSHIGHVSVSKSRLMLKTVQLLTNLIYSSSINLWKNNKYHFKMFTYSNIYFVMKHSAIQLKCKYEYDILFVSYFYLREAPKCSCFSFGHVL